LAGAMGCAKNTDGGGGETRERGERLSRKKGEYKRRVNWEMRERGHDLNGRRGGQGAGTHEGWTLREKRTWINRTAINKGMVKTNVNAGGPKVFGGVDSREGRGGIQTKKGFGVQIGGVGQIR